MHSNNSTCQLRLCSAVRPMVPQLTAPRKGHLLALYQFLRILRIVDGTFRRRFYGKFHKRYRAMLSIDSLSVTLPIQAYLRNEFIHKYWCFESQYFFGECIIVTSIDVTFTYCVR